MDRLAREFAAELLSQRRSKVAERALRLADGTGDERHAVRIAAKRLRYAAEFFAPLFRRKRTGVFLSALSSLQDALGRFNDAVTAARLAAELGGGGKDSAAGAVHGWVAAQAAAGEPGLLASWSKFAAAKPFWQKD